MNRDYAFLEPIQIGNKTFRNRIIYPAMGKHIATEDGFVNDEYIAYFRSVARGGVGALVTGIQVIDPTWHYISNRQTWICDDKYIPGLKKLADAIHEEGCIIFFQPWHSGAAGVPTGITDGKPKTCNDFSVEEIHEIQEMWFQAARRAKEAGADGIEFHCAHTYLPAQFLSPYFNHRTDEYGADTVENGLRFSIEIIERIQRELCDENFMVIAKINGDDYVDGKEDNGGTNLARCQEACRLFEKAGVKMITVNGGGALTGAEYMSDNGVQPEGWKVHLAEGVKSAVNIPVAASGSLRHPAFVDQLIREGRADMAAIGRGIFAERDWVKKCMEGREDELRYCISCMYCFTTAPDGTTGCSVNPFAKRELDLPAVVKDGERRKVLVVGAGPSGLEAAVTLAERDFDVAVVDERNTLGGLVQYAIMPPHKTKLAWMLEYYEKQFHRLGITFIGGIKADEAYIDGFGADVVVMATGSREFVPPVPGADHEAVESIRQAFEKLELAGRENPYGGKTVILGAGLTGIELGHLIQSRGGSVEILELQPKPAAMIMELKLSLKAAYADGVEVKYGQKVTGIADGKVLTVEDAETGETRELQADHIIRSMGIHSENALLGALKAGEKPYTIVAVGDCAATGKISTAVQSGADAAFAVK